MDWFGSATPETERLPLEWRMLESKPFHKLAAVKALRPDRFAEGLKKVCRAVLPDGRAFADADADLSSFQVLAAAFEDAAPEVPVLFVLSPAVDVVADVDKLAKKCGMVPGQSYVTLSLGQGQGSAALHQLREAHRQGHWVLLCNVHLVPAWLGSLVDALAALRQEGSHPNFRVFLSAAPLQTDLLPIALLERCIRLTADPPAGLRASLKRALCCFPKDTVEEMEPAERGVLFGLAHFHALLLERRAFGTRGFNEPMKLNLGPSDLVHSAKLLATYMEEEPPVMPWADLK